MTTKFKGKYRVESTRLPNWDYAANGWYFVTICTRDRECFFGEAIAGLMQLSEIGQIAQQFWSEIPIHSQRGVYLDEYIIMPNHIHGIVVINRSAADKDVTCNVSIEETGIEHEISRAMSDMSPKSGTLSVILRSYKSAVSRWCRMNGYNSFAWQERFHDEIIRNDRALEKIREYIANNPAKWEYERNNPVGLWM